MRGRLLAGRYRLESVVGRGGMGTVWRARDETLDRDIAVKEVVLPSGLSDDERDNRHRRTLREARASARLNHPGVVTVHDVVDEDDRPWIVMELVRARSLQDIVDGDGPLPPARVADIGRQIAGALRAAHAIGILHRDVKPANVLVADDDRAVLTDFGIAQMAGDATLTATGLLIGSPAYMSPERVNGDPAAPASDLWALGATLYAATEGRAPHHRSDAMAVLAAILTQDVPPPRNAGPLTPVLTGLLERDPARRMSGDRAEEALKAIASGRDAGLVAAEMAPGGTTTPDAPPAASPSPSPSPAAHPAAPQPPSSPAGTGQAAPPPEPPPAPPLAPSPAPLPATAPAHGMTTQSPPGTGGQWTHGHASAAAPGRGRRRSIVAPILAGAVVATVILASAGFLLWPDGGSPGGGSPGGADASRQPTTVAKQSPPDAAPETTPAASPEGPSPIALPDGLVQASGPGYTIGVPRGWRRTVRSKSVYWTDPESSAYIQVDRTPWAGTPYDHWLDWERRAIADGNLRNYRRVSLSRTSVAGVPAADIEFTWYRNTGLTRARDRGVIAGGRWYAVVVAVPASQWNENESLVKNVLDTFRPSGVG